MMDINIWAVLVATVASFITGALWYSPVLFMKTWCRETGINPEENISNPGKVYGLTFVFTLLSAFVLAILLGPQPELMYALVMSAVAGAGLVACSMGINYLFASKSLLVWCIDGGFHIFRFMIIGLVLGLWH